MTGREHKALPGPVIDLIRDGARPADLRRQGDRAVWHALVRTAASAQQRGWAEPGWTALISETRSHLGRQARLKRGRTERTSRDYHQTLTAAWQAAVAWLRQAPPAFDADAIREQITTIQTMIADADTPIAGAERAVLAYAVEVAQRNGTTRPALPRREIQIATGLSEWTVRATLTHLHDAGVLTLAVRGRPAGADSHRRRASCYRLPAAEALDTYLYRGTRSVGGNPQVYGRSDSEPVGRPAQVYGRETVDVGTITVIRNPDGTMALTGPPAVLERAVAAMQAGHPVVVAGTDSTPNIKTLASPRYLHAVPERHGDADDGDRPGDVRSVRGRRRPA